jgi:hypothetical protein
MPYEPSGSCPPVQQAPSTPAGRSASCCQGCRRATARLASRQRAAAMRLLIAPHPEEWAGLLALVGGRHPAASHAPAGDGTDG